jgi:hypothetical protein
MSTVKIKGIQIGNGNVNDTFVIYQPTFPDGTVRIARGNLESSSDVLIISSNSVVATGSITAPSFLGNISASSITSGTLVTQHGGTGQLTYDDGQILIGSDGGLVKSTITAGPGITIQNSPGSITISSNTTGTTNLGIINGTTGGPTITSSSGLAAVFPVASQTVSGAVTTGNQTFSGVKTFLSQINGSVSGSAGSLTSSLTAGSNIVGSSFNGSSNVTWSVDATPGSSGSVGINKIVSRNASGDFYARNIYASNFIGTVSYAENSNNANNASNLAKNVSSGAGISVSGSLQFGSGITISVDSTVLRTTSALPYLSNSVSSTQTGGFRNIRFNGASGGITTLVSASSGNYSLTLPQKSGTIATTSDIGSPPAYGAVGSYVLASTTLSNLTAGSSVAGGSLNLAGGTHSSSVSTPHLWRVRWADSLLGAWRVHSFISSQGDRRVGLFQRIS